MKTILALISIFFMVPFENGETVYDFKLESIAGHEVDMMEFEGSVLLVVNTASECGFTSQYEGLQNIHNQYKERNFYVLGFPANNFGGQEPGTNEDILEFCKVNFGVDFPLFSKISVRGDNIHPLFEYLTNVVNDDFPEKLAGILKSF
jgi:glutathione peroxidase